MAWKREWKPIVAVVAVFLATYHLPVGFPRFDTALVESLELAKWYAREHVVLCLLPAFLIAGAISTFLDQATIMKHLGAGARKVAAYGVASVSGAVLAVCSCTVLPLFAGIFRMGAGLGPATTFLYAGPAINVLAVILTARILGVPLGVGRALGAIGFSIVIGLLMHLIFRRQEEKRTSGQPALPDSRTARPVGQSVAFFASLIAVLVFANWGEPASQEGFWRRVFELKWGLTVAAAIALCMVLKRWFGLSWRRLFLMAALPAVAAAFSVGGPQLTFAVGTVAFCAVMGSEGGMLRAWLAESWGFAKQMLPLLLLGVLAAGFFLGRPGREGLIPAQWVAEAVGGNGLAANLFAAVAGVFMYFATLTEVPILQGLLGAGMGQGPALALLLAGPALSLPSLLVLHGIMGWRRTCVFMLLVVVMATVSGLIYGFLAH